MTVGSNEDVSEGGVLALDDKVATGFLPFVYGGIFSKTLRTVETVEALFMGARSWHTVTD